MVSVQSEGDDYGSDLYRQHPPNFPLACESRHYSPICMGDSFGLRKMVLPTVLGNGRHLLEARLNKCNLRLVTRAEILKEWNAMIVVDDMPQLVQRVLAAEGGRC